MKRKYKTISIIIKVFISVSILAALFLHLDQEQRSIIASFKKQFDISTWGTAIILITAQMLLLSMRWKELLNIGRTRLTNIETIRINLTSQLANLVFIASIGGLLVRITLCLQKGAALYKIILATAIDRGMTLLSLILLSALFLPRLSDYIDNSAFSILSTYLSIVIVLTFLCLPLLLNFTLNKTPIISKLKGKLRYIARYLQILINKPLLLTKIVSLSLIAQTCFFLSVFCLCKSSGIDLSFYDVMAVLPAISLIASLPISIGGWGVREGAFVFGLGLLDIPMETSLIISIEIGLIGIATTVITGIPAMLMSDINTKNLNSSLLTAKADR